MTWVIKITHPHCKENNLSTQKRQALNWFWGLEDFSGPETPIPSRGPGSGPLQGWVGGKHSRNYSHTKQKYTLKEWAWAHSGRGSEGHQVDVGLWLLWVVVTGHHVGFWEEEGISKNSAWYYSCSALATLWRHSLTFLLGRPHASSRSFGCPLAPPVEGPFPATCKITGSWCACVPWAPSQGSAAHLLFLSQCPSTSFFYPPHNQQAWAMLTRISFPPLSVAPPPLPGAAAYFPAFSDPGLAASLSTTIRSRWDLAAWCLQHSGGFSCLEMDTAALLNAK